MLRRQQRMRCITEAGLHVAVPAVHHVATLLTISHALATDTCHFQLNASSWIKLPHGRRNFHGQEAESFEAELFFQAESRC